MNFGCAVWALSTFADFALLIVYPYPESPTKHTFKKIAFHVYVLDIRRMRALDVHFYCEPVTANFRALPLPC